MMMLAALLQKVERLAVWLAGIGAMIIIVQMLWISYGVFMRYVISKPDGMVTEATALLLFPAAFLGLAFALKEDAYPKVSFLLDALQPRGRRWLEALNFVLMIIVGGFFAIAAVKATMGSFESGAASEILLWPRYLFWGPGALALTVFTIHAGLKLAVLVAASSDDMNDPTASHGKPS
ncbi:TRAP transporter small permease [Limnohabitans sp. 2KL-27]|jgi:TRAP-type C4-dicarboxylate transport system permease small subunit|uniref:TRAP transporter small permease n=1 Tax=Limnohabitans sp. 2KL-27 TaxID=1100705 RepID=UPI000AAFEB94|nr:TRAP transporter small permease [Limnohabitans sp. 2KL-27]